MACRKVLYEDSDGGKLETIDVYLRVKPSKCEDQAKLWKISDDRYVTISCPASSRALKRKIGKHEENRFQFTHIFGPDVQQQQLFEKCIETPLVDFIGGHNSLVFSYGTSSCGKTYTIQGTKNNPGIIPRVLHLLFNTLNGHLTDKPEYMPYMNGVIDICDQSRKQLDELKRTLTEEHCDEIDMMLTDVPEMERAFRQMEAQLDSEMRLVDAQCAGRQYSLWISFMEIYNEALYDLLVPPRPPQHTRKQLKLAEDTATKTYYVKDVSYVDVSTPADAYKVLMFGKKNLQMASTGQNKHSSRSHCIFTLSLVHHDKEVNVSRLSICDLAGVERQKNTQNMGDRLKESQHINCSLHVLRRCFDRMRDNQSRAEKLVVPYRESKLTKLFQKPLSGEGKVIMLVNVNLESNFEELLAVLKASAIARKVIISETGVTSTPAIRKRPRSQLFTASLAEHNRTNSVINCDLLEEQNEPTFLAMATIDDEEEATPMKKLKVIPPSSSSSKPHSSRTTRTNASESANLRKEVETLKASIEIYKEKHEKMSTEIAELKSYKMREMEEAKHNSEVKKLLEDMNVMKKTMQKNIDDKVAVLREAFTEIQYYEKDIVDLSKRNEKLEQELVKKDTKLDELSKQMSVNDTVMTANIDKNEELEAMVDKLQEEMEQLQQTAERKDSQLNQQTQQLHQLAAQLDSLNKSHNDRLLENFQLKRDLEKAQEREEKLNAEYKKAIDQVESLRKEVVRMNEDSKLKVDRENENMQLISDLKKAREREVNLNADYKKTMDQVESLKAELETNNLRMNENAIREVDRLQEIRLLESDLHQACEREKELNVDYRVAIAGVERLRAEVYDYNQRNKALVAVIDMLEKRIDDNVKNYQSTLASKDEEIKSISSLLDAKTRTNEELKSASEELQRRYAALLKKLDEDLRTKDEQLAEMKRQLDVCMLEKDLLEKECEHSTIYTREVELDKTTQYWGKVEEIEELNRQKRALETSFEELARSLEEETSHTSLLLNQIENEKLKVSELQSFVVKMRRRNIRLKRLLDKTRGETNARELYLVRQLEKKKEELREEKDKVDSFKTANEDLKLGLIKCEEKFIEYEKKIETLLENNEKTSNTTSSLTYYKNEIKHLKYELSKCEEKYLKVKTSLDSTVDKISAVRETIEEESRRERARNQYSQAVPCRGNRNTQERSKTVEKDGRG
ncbi:kinesin-like protein KIF20A [Nilaparvata lugens]|uniref:kinesin-like protein KIF20A n=1 Tax=Nilaparvata lugens TaxID=108931 RepID=UPI00193CE0FC|nr:kinesin-like protein KIF20A [Nilaparvata lugens]